MAKPEPRITEKASALPASDRYCTHCARKLANRMAWLELDQRTNTYHDFSDVPADRSQGWFPFGMDCARSFLKAEADRRAA